MKTDFQVPNTKEQAILRMEYLQKEISKMQMELNFLEYSLQAFDTKEDISLLYKEPYEHEI